MKQALAVLTLVTGLFGSGGMALAYDVVGAGAWSCTAWTDLRKNLKSDTSEQWTLGFLSGVGFVGGHGAEPLRGLAPQDVADWFDKYCRSHPKDTIARAAEMFSASRHVFSAPTTTETTEGPASKR